jgi:hypothetical protein
MTLLHKVLLLLSSCRYSTFIFMGSSSLDWAQNPFNIDLVSGLIPATVN